MLRRHVRGPARYTFGRKLRELRKSRQLTIASCASLLGVSKSLWTEAELGNHEPFEDHQLDKIRTVLHTLASYPITDDEYRDLRIAAATTRGTISLSLGGNSAFQRELALRLQDQWQSLTPTQLVRLSEALD